MVDAAHNHAVQMPHTPHFRSPLQLSELRRPALRPQCEAIRAILLTGQSIIVGWTELAIAPARADSAIATWQHTLIDPLALELAPGDSGTASTQRPWALRDIRERVSEN